MLDDIVSEIEAFATEKLKQEPTIPFSLFERYLYDNTPQLSTLKHKPAPIDKRLSSLKPSIPHKDYAITIIGAGSAGLLIALALGKLGYQITVYEKRSPQSFNLRYPNISFKEGDTTLKTLVGENLFAKFLETGGSMDGLTGKLRLSIGSFQDTLLDHISQLSNVNICFDSEFDFKQHHLFEQSNLVLLATGVHAAKQFDLSDKLDIQRFSDFNVNGRSALYVLDAGSKKHGYYRRDIEGYHWRRDNQSIYSGKNFTPDLMRLVRQIDEQALAEKLESFCHLPSVEYTFSFGNDTANFFDSPPTSCQPLLQATFAVKPQVALNPFITINNTPVLAIGDSNGTPHPLAAIGTLKFVRNIPHLIEFLNRERAIADTGSNELTTLNQQRYIELAMQNIKEVFFSNIMSSIYSRARE